MPNWKKVIVSGSDASLSTLTITNSGSTDDSLLLTATEDSSTAAPVVTFKRNTGTAADADYLGQLKFKGENDADQEVTYAKITAKILDASDGTEDGLIEFANKKAGSNVITARLRSDSFQLLNDTNLSVDGQISASSLISNNFSGSFQGDGSSLTGIDASIVSSSTVSETFSNKTTHSIAHTLGTKDLIVNVYDSNDDIFIPTRINTPTTSSVVLHMDPATSGRVVIGKSGHIVSGSQVASYDDLTDVPSGILSSSAQITTNISGSSTALSSSIAGRVTTNTTNITALDGEVTNLMAATGSQFAHIGNLNTKTGSLDTEITALESFSSSLSSTIISYTGSFSGLGTGLTNVTSSKSINTRDSSTVSFWQGSQAQYDALGSYDSNVIYFTT
tara:strand:+ start:456 stop:1625 length:1170 start_codon:yes stop_codon:yes gene_type:complete